MLNVSNKSSKRISISTKAGVAGETQTPKTIQPGETHRFLVDTQDVHKLALDENNCHHFTYPTEAIHAQIIWDGKKVKNHYRVRD